MTGRVSLLTGELARFDLESDTANCSITARLIFTPECASNPSFSALNKDHIVLFVRLATFSIISNRTVVSRAPSPEVWSIFQN